MSCETSLNSQIFPRDIATVETISANVWFYTIDVQLKPTNEAVADEVYSVDIYEKGNFRATKEVSWNQYEINVSSIKLVSFPSTYNETGIYFGHDLSQIFTVKVHESTIIPSTVSQKSGTLTKSAVRPTTTPSVTLIITPSTTTPTPHITTTQTPIFVLETTIQDSLTNSDDGDSTTWATSQIRGQTWTPLVTFRLSYIEVFMRRVGQPGNATLVVKATDGNNPIGQAIATASVTTNNITIANSWVRFDVSGVDLAAGKTYWWGIYATSGSPSDNYYAIRYDAQNGYQRGAMWNSSSGIAQPFAQYDDLFKVYGQSQK